MKRRSSASAANAKFREARQRSMGIVNVEKLVAVDGAALPQSAQSTPTFLPPWEK